MKKLIFLGILSYLSLILFVSCGKAPSDEFNSEYLNSQNGGRYLYVVSGACYGGGVTTSTSTATISRFDKETGAFNKLLVDYNSLSAGDNPVSIVDKDNDYFLVLVENTGGRRVDIVNKHTSEVSTYLTNTTALNAVARSLKLLSDGSLLISKSSAIEKFNAAKARVLMGANPYVNAPAGSCATSTTLIPSMTTLSNGKIVYVHAAASPNNKIGLVSATGYAAAADCLSTQAAPATTALPTSVLRHSSGKILVSYGSTTAASNLIYSYSLNATTNAFSAATAAYNDIANINGPSAMIEDTETGDVFVANAISTYNNVERFSFDSTAGTLTKIGTSPFLPASIYTRCVSSMMVGD